MAIDVVETDLSGGIPVEREYVLAQCPAEPGFRDAVNVWIEEESGDFAMRVGVEAVSDAWDRHEIWLDIAFADGRLYQRRGDGDTRDAIGPEGLPTIRATGPVAFRCVEPFRRWTVTFKGDLARLTAQDLIENPNHQDSEFVDAEFSIDMTMVAPPWIPGSLLPEAAEALGGEQGDFMSPRYEQLFRCTGTLRIGDETRAFNGNGLRIRRSGFRAFAGFWGHCWQSAVFPSGKAFGFNIYPPREDGTLNYAEGFIIDADGTRTPARPVQVPWLRKLVTGGEPVPFVLETIDGRRVSIDGVTFANTRSRSHIVMPTEWPIVQQAHARYVWDGEETTGMIERSSLRAVMDL
ncbi:hypothetical protein [Novosphingobium album (ex Liu et al. 2023)]|uniref:Uncharacterized protein n=1 Tax=Novosphingobium album (ex Liu et al. 2023) TaxID=3031130 RepID=A0ABT5WKA0_9SPHN|nr:hypothetical protein [Novosphingobium album (ex Liu et al. 2023)]MDE8650126.1 hypothetical protein [Novosphingobium album (ex Liu et al. 2023)]